MGISFDEMVALYTSESAIQRPNTVEEVGNAAVMLASDLGAGITGAAISVDGGTSPY
jgi:3-hydroxybutyrate dehydrogenase/3-oxoacyl-[acyl-carrier protein] reductase